MIDKVVIICSALCNCCESVVLPKMLYNTSQNNYDVVILLYNYYYYSKLKYFFSNQFINHNYKIKNVERRQNYIILYIFLKINLIILYYIYF